jgi:hypothetical protein
MFHSGEKGERPKAAFSKVPPDLVSPDLRKEK